MRESITNEFFRLSTWFLIPNMLKLAQKGMKKAELCEFVIKLCDSAGRICENA